MTLLEEGEWFRVMVGRCLALAQFEGTRWRFLVTGVPLDQIDGSADSSASDRLHREIDRDLEMIGEAVKAHRGRVQDKKFLYDCLGGYVMIRCLRLPQDDANWHITDEGLFVSDWGLSTGKSLLDWNDEDFKDMRRRLHERIDTQLGEATGTATVRPETRAAVEQHRHVIDDPNNYPKATVPPARKPTPSKGPPGRPDSRPPIREQKSRRSNRPPAAILHVGVFVVAALVTALVMVLWERFRDSNGDAPVEAAEPAEVVGPPGRSGGVDLSAEPEHGIAGSELPIEPVRAYGLEGDVNGIPDSGEDCVFDLDGDGVVGPGDLGIVLDSVSVGGGCGACEGDVNGDGVVDAGDFEAMLAAWGACAP